MTVAILDHLWQSTLVAALIGALTFLFRNNSPSVRHGLWFIASVKFLLPFALLSQIGRMSFTHPVAAESFATLARIEPAAVPFATFTTQAATAQHLPWTLLAACLWAFGSFFILLFWLVRAWRLSAIVRGSTPLALEAPIPVRATSELLEPGLVGIFRPVVLVPESLTGQLSQTEINAILAHEICHLRRRDNLTAAIHMLVEAVFWFHPLVWLIGARLVEEREHACDEAVLHAGRKPLDYAHAILKVCRFYFRSPLPCASGVSGADLDRRITAIMTQRDADEVDPRKILLLATLGLLTIATPLVTGGLKSVPVLTQSLADIVSPLEQAYKAPTVTETVLAVAPAQDTSRRQQRKPAASAASRIHENVLTAPKIDVPAPIIIVPAPQIAVEEAQPPAQAATADADVNICRPPQQLPESRLAGPQVCLPKHEWDRISALGLVLLPDGRTLVTDYEKQRALNPRNCVSPSPTASAGFSSWNLSCFLQ